MHPFKLSKLACFLGLAIAFCVGSPSQGAILDNLIAYYDFNGSGTAGIANQVSGSYHGSYIAGTTTTGVNPSLTVAGAGAGFAGGTFAGDNPTNSTVRPLLNSNLGGILNVYKDDSSTTAGRGAFQVPISSATLTNNFTISAWFFAAPDADNTVVGASNNTGRSYLFEPSTNFDISFGTGTPYGTNYGTYLGEGGFTSTTVDNGVWHHLVYAVSESGGNSTYTLYIDGATAGTGTVATSAISFSAINFGAARTGYRVFDGTLEELGIWTRTLSASEVNQLRAAGIAGTAITAIPEPSTYAFVMLSGLGLLAWKRRSAR